jgi:hypothetical protein
VPSTPSSEGPVVRSPVVRGPRSLVLGLWSVVRSPWSVVLPLAAFALLWFDLCHQLSYVWQTNEQYAYGWFVPVLALGLFIKKWPSRPSLGLQDHGTTGLPDDHRPQAAQPLNHQQPVVRDPFLLSAFPISTFALPAFIFLLSQFLLLSLRFQLSAFQHLSL